MMAAGGPPPEAGSRPVQAAPRTSSARDTRDGDSPRTATASSWVPTASARQTRAGTKQASATV